MNESTSSQDMRYDGAPRRSQKAQKDVLDKIWSFFSSVRVGVWLIILTLLGALIGSIYPQEGAFLRPPDISYYESNYGWLGKWYYLTGFSDTYGSWWFKLLVVMLGTSIIIASIDRGIPLFKILHKQRPDRSIDFLKRQKIFMTFSPPSQQLEPYPSAEWSQRVEKQLSKQRFHVSTSTNAWLGEKNRWCRWGPYVNHVGLIIFLLIILIRTWPSFTLEEYLFILEGDTVPIPATNFYVKNEKFTVVFYENEELRGQFQQEQRVVPKLYETRAILYECSERCGTSDPVLTEVSRANIEVNKPLKYQGFALYQFGYDITPQIISLTVALKDKVTNESYGEFLLRTRNPDLAYEAGPYQLRLHNYYPEFALDERGEPTTVSAENPNAPAYVFVISGPDLPAEGVNYLYFPREIDKIRFGQEQINQAVGSGERFVIEAGGMENVNIAEYTSTLVARKDLTVPYLLIAGLISMVGLVMTFYWQHRRIWVVWDGAKLIIAAHTNKNWHGMKREVEKLLVSLGLQESKEESVHVVYNK
jgi:cytochrome c biogenesis protein